MGIFETAFLGDTDALLQRTQSGSGARLGCRPFQCQLQQRGRQPSRHSVDLGQRSVLLKAHGANVVHAATAVAVAPQQTHRHSCDIEFSWAEQRRLLEESYNARPAPETVRAHASKVWLSLHD
jgi:hypothetical protein